MNELKYKIQRVQELSVLYRIKQCNRNARCQLSQKMYANKKDKEHFIKKVKGRRRASIYNSNLISLCWISLKEKNLRPIYVNSVIGFMQPMHATIKSKLKMKGFLKPKWFEGYPTLLLVNDIRKSRKENNEDIEFDFDIGNRKLLRQPLFFQFPGVYSLS